MSRRVGAPGPDRSEQNRATLKQLVKLEANKTCSDCKRNKHPRWASWNIGVFICIRCSGIHRGMGTHISRVKSVDLDSWTDEQLQSMVRWGNARANVYWEHKLAPGHVPNDSKMENFIRTKYDSKRWVMDGPIPDPATLDDGAADDDVPLKIVQERARSGSGANSRATSQTLPQPPQQRKPVVDLFGDDIDSAPVPARPSTVDPAASSRLGAPKAPAAPPKSTKPGDSLLGLDFLGGSSSAAPARPSSTGPAAGGPPKRTDLKQSILSLYASKPAAPAPQQQQQQPASSNFGQFGGMQQPQQSNAQALGGMDDAFGSLSFSSAPQSAASKPTTPFSNLTSPTASQPKASALSGGSFFDMKPTSPPKQPVQPTNAARKESFGGDWGDFSSAASPPVPSAKPAAPAPANGSSMGDLFSLSPVSSNAAPAPVSRPTNLPKSPPPIDASKFAGTSSAFNLSQPAKPAAPAPQTNTSSTNFGAMSGMDAWGSDNAWSTPDSPPAKPAAPAPAPTKTIQPTSFSPVSKPAAPQMSSGFDGGWGDPMPTTTASSSGPAVQQDDDFGGWSHASPVATKAEPAKPASNPSGGGMGGGSDDLFGNVWG